MGGGGTITNFYFPECANFLIVCWIFKMVKHGVLFHDVILC